MKKFFSCFVGDCYETQGLESRSFGKDENGSEIKELMCIEHRKQDDAITQILMNNPDKAKLFEKLVLEAEENNKN